MAVFTKNLVIVGCPALLLFAAIPANSRSYQPQFELRILTAHNAARGAIGAAPIQWDANLQSQAASYAAYLAAHNMFAHSSAQQRGGTGENLWMGTRGAFTVESMFAGWNSEKSAFRPGVFPAVSRSGNWHDVGHYTQVVWPQTKRVGCAVASNAGYDFLVCRYWPAGNVHGASIPAYRQLAISSAR